MSLDGHIPSLHKLTILQVHTILASFVKARAAKIFLNFVGLKFQVHGKEYIDVLFTEAMVGHKLGEF